MRSRNLSRARRLSMTIVIGGNKVANSLQQSTLYSKSMIPLYLGPWTCVCDANNGNPQIMHVSAHSSPTQMKQHGRSVAGTMHGQVQTANMQPGDEFTLVPKVLAVATLLRCHIHVHKLQRRVNKKNVSIKPLSPSLYPHSPWWRLCIS
jgi:invasion protein IalB